MTTPHYDYAVFIGRFQPFHIGHLFVFESALEQADKLIALIGSSHGARTLRNPFSFEERAEMIQTALPDTIRNRVILKPIEDFTYNDAAWVQSVTETVTKTAAEDTVESTTSPTIALVGHDKDETTYYLKLFPNWAYIEVGNLDGINATGVRKRYFTAGNPAYFDSKILNQATIDWLRAFSQRDTFIALSREFQAVQTFKDAWSNTPYPVIFTTTDALVRYGDEILLITRKHFPGKGLFALPGGFLDKDETLINGCLRELTEETQLAVSQTQLLSALKNSHVFDNPKRSTRGRVVTHCYYFDISALPEKPTTHAQDDALSVHWQPISQLKKSDFFEDHYFIIQTLLNE